MSQRFGISKLSIEGFRGINRKINIDFGGGSAVLFGPNGVGKSSIVQAIEWCLFGRLVSALSGPTEFKKEDAIVNSFHPQRKAAVRMILQGEKGKTVAISRERKKDRSTTAGKTELRIEVGGTQYSGDEGQVELNKLLGMTATEFYASACLHQEAVRDLIVGDPLTRSEVVDKLLGLHFVRDLIDYLPLKHVARESKAIEDDIEDIKDKRMQEVVISRKRLAELQVDLQESGIEEEQLNTPSLVRQIEEASDEIERIAQTMRIEMREGAKPVTDLLSLEKRAQEAEDRIEQLEAAWTGNYKKTVTMTSDLRRLKQMYEQAMTEVTSLATQDPKELLALQSDTSDKISKIEQELSRQISARDFLQDESVVAHRLKVSLDQTVSELETLVKEFGEKAKIEESIRRLESQMDDRRVQIRKEQALSSILVCGLDYLKTTSSDVCPLCKSRIVCHDTIQILEKETGEKEGAKAIRELQSDLQKLTSEKTRLETALTNYDGLATQMHKLRAAVDTEKQKLIQKSFEPEDQLARFVDEELKRINTRISGIDAEVRELRSKATQLTLEVRNLHDKNTRMRSVEKEAQGAVKTSATGQDLIDQLADQMKNLQEDTKSLERITEDLKTPKERLGMSKRILDFLKEKEKVERMERGLPALQQRVKELEEKYSRVRELEAGLTDIYNVTSAAREEMVKVALMELQSFVSKYYSKLMCHPYYVNIQLIPEEERGKAIYRIMGWDKELKQGTYVQTRFSNAQMNAVAISLFLSMCVRLQCNFGVILLDDPSQSMDRAHKEALSKVLNEISKERQIVVATQDPELKQLMEESMTRPRVITYQLEEWDTEGPQISTWNRSKRKTDPKK